jgi:ArsR family transcriptional regulator
VTIARRGKSGWKYIPKSEYGFGRVELVKIYECLCDVTRLRLLNVLTQGTLCVCHFQAVLREPQVKISKHLGYLRTRGLVECERRGNWMIYGLPAKPSRELRANLACLQDCAREDPVFRRDLERLRRLTPKLAESGPCGCAANAMTKGKSHE